jgi:hypothetical protein
MVYQVSTRFLNHDHSFWKNYVFILKNHGLLLEKTQCKWSNYLTFQVVDHGFLR